MAKWSGKIGYASETESTPGIWTETITERQYYGDFTKNYRSLQNSNQIIDSVNISNQISIVSDPYALENFHKMRYAYFMGKKWKVSTVDVEYPRLLLTLGGIYNEDQIRPSDNS